MNCPGLSTTKAQEKPRMGRCIRGAQVDTNGTEKAFEAVVFYLSTSLRRNEIVLLFRNEVTHPFMGEGITINLLTDQDLVIISKCYSLGTLSDSTNGRGGLY